MSIQLKNLLLALALITGTFFLYKTIADNQSTQQKVAFSDFMNWVEQGNISEAVIQDAQISFSLEEQGLFKTILPKQYNNLPDTLYKNGVRFKIKNAGGEIFLFSLLLQWLPIILLIAIWVYIMRQMQSGNKIMGMSKFKPKELNEDQLKITFKDVAGIDEAIHEVEEIVEYLKSPSKFEKLGGRIPAGVLLSGQPGTGKTLLAKAIAGEAGVGFFSISGSDFVEMFVGVGASRVRDLFEKAREDAPCIIFIDEIDAVGRNRGSGMGGGNDEREQTLNQLLIEMDGFSGNEGVIVIAATNRPDVLDSALTRPGRFDRSVIVPPPDMNGRHQILKIHSKNVKVNENVDLEVLAKGTPGYTGAQLANLVNEAALLAGREGKKTVDKQDFENARDKIMMGSERRTLVMKKNELESTAYHEAGHAIIASLSEHVDPVHKVTVIPRGKALGVTMLLPDDEKHYYTRRKLNAMLEMMMGGRAAEEIIFNHYTTGASNDLERANDIAHSMVCKWGMSEKIGPIFLGEDEGSVFLGKDMMRRKKISQKAAMQIDQEVKFIVNNAYKKAMKILRTNLEALHRISQELIQQETIDGTTVKGILEEYQTAKV